MTREKLNDIMRQAASKAKMYDRKARVFRGWNDEFADALEAASDWYLDIFDVLFEILHEGE
jgi:hypothetical protein